MKGPRFLLLGIAVLVSITQCKPSPEAAKEPVSLSKAEVTEISSPSTSGSGEPNLSTGPDGRIYLSWIESMDDKATMKFSVLAENLSWSPATVVATGDHWLINSAEYPSVIALQDGTLAAHWLDDSIPGSDAYGVRLTFSRDGGKTWSKPIIPHRDRSANQHGFVSLVATGPSEIAALWLDGRKLKDEVGDMALMYTTIGSDGKLGKEAELDDRTCECCQTAAAVTPDGIVAVYRDRSEKEIRDISVVRHTKDGWTKPEAVSHDNWQIYGCPVNGPSVSAAGMSVAAAWFTAPDDASRVNAVLSKDGGKTFGNPIRIDNGKPLGRVDVIALPSGGALVSWLELADSGLQVRMRQIEPGGTLKDSIVVSAGISVSNAGVPQMTRRTNQANQIVVAWTDREKPAKVRTVSVKFE